MKKICEFFNKANKVGLSLPMAHDSLTGKPSVTLLGFYLGLLLSVGSLIAYHFFSDKLIGPASMTLLFLGMTFVFYKIRQLDKVKLDLDDREITLEDTQDNNEKEEKNEQ